MSLWRVCSTGSWAYFVSYLGQFFLSEGPIPSFKGTCYLAVQVWQACVFQWCSSSKDPFSLASTWVTNRGFGPWAMCCHKVCPHRKWNFFIQLSHHGDCLSCLRVSENIIRCTWAGGGGVFPGKHHSLQLPPLSRVPFTTHSFKQFYLGIPHHPLISQSVFEPGPGSLRKLGVTKPGRSQSGWHRPSIWDSRVWPMSEHFFMYL